MRRYHQVLTAAAIRASRKCGSGTRDEIDDIIQEIYLHLCSDGARILTSFRDPRPEALFGYLKIVATNLAHDVFRRHAAAKRGDGRTEPVENADRLAGPAEDMDRRLSLGEIDDVLVEETRQKENGSRDRTVFRLYYRHGMTARAIAGLPGIGLNPKGVEAVIYRLTTAIRRALGEVQELGAE
jgi:RNA polymerase sigma-70 factor (ECF subfamily)